MHLSVLFGSNLTKMSPASFLAKDFHKGLALRRLNKRNWQSNSSLFFSLFMCYLVVELLICSKKEEITVTKETKLLILWNGVSAWEWKAVTDKSENSIPHHESACWWKQVGSCCLGSDRS